MSAFTAEQLPPFPVMPPEFDRHLDEIDYQHDLIAALRARLALAVDTITAIYPSDHRAHYEGIIAACKEPQ